MENVDENGEQRLFVPKQYQKRKKKRGGAKRLGDEVDRLSNLPESLLLQVLLNLPTKDVVKSSVLSSRWRNLWQFVPGLDLKYSDIPELNGFVSFVDGFLGFNTDSCIQKFKLRIQWKKDEEPDIARFTRFINTVVERKVQNLRVSARWDDAVMQIPPTVYTCASLVSLKLNNVILPNPEFVSLPCVKVIDLYAVQFPNDLAFEMLISGCPVLESLTISRRCFDNVQVLRVRSQSLLRFTYSSRIEGFKLDIDRQVAIDAPRLEYLKLYDHETHSFIINNSPSLVKVNINIEFGVIHLRNKFEPKKRNMIHNFLVAISTVKYMEITSETLEIIYHYLSYEPLPPFPNLSFLNCGFEECTWEMLVIFLGRCPNLKSLVMLSNLNLEDGIGSLPRPQCLLSSLEFVRIYGMEMKLVSYFLENSAILKKLTLCLDDDDYSMAILKELLTIPRLSASCQVVID